MLTSASASESPEIASENQSKLAYIKQLLQQHHKEMRERHAGLVGFVTRTEDAKGKLCHLQQHAKHVERSAEVAQLQVAAS